MADVTKRPLFVYGTLREPKLLQAVLGHPLDGITIRTATARGHRTVFYPGRIYPALVEAPSDAATGELIAGLSAGDIAILDLFEGEEYVRRPLAVEVEGTRVEAEVFWPTAATEPAGQPWTFESWRERHGAAMILAEGETAMTLRRQLIERDELEE
jgi:gamma-glutamylcyclotransferase (GGCT)/AIG2-like uncharacterized protein YtfP